MKFDATPMTPLVLCAALAMTAAPAFAQEVEEEATAEETQSVADSIARIGCEAETVEKESDDLYEIDDAVCEIGQYDIKLDGEFTIISMTYDGPAEEDVGGDEGNSDEAQIPQDTVDQIMAMLTDMECEMDPDDIAREDGGYDLDDVICAGEGQFDITLDENLEITNRRAE